MQRGNYDVSVRKALHPDYSPNGMRLLYDVVGMTDRTPIAFQSHTNRTLNVGSSEQDIVHTDNYLVPC